MKQPTARQRDYYLQMMQKAQQLNDQGLIHLIVKKMAGLGMPGALTTASGCQVIPFPPLLNRETNMEPEPPLWWVLIKLTVLIPGSLTILLLLAMYSNYPTMWDVIK
jgi:hypothetical protein